MWDEEPDARRDADPDAPRVPCRVRRAWDVFRRDPAFWVTLIAVLWSVVSLVVTLRLPRIVFATDVEVVEAVGRLERWRRRATGWAALHAAMTAGVYVWSRRE